MNLKTIYKAPSNKSSHEDLLSKVAEKKDKAAFVELFHYFAPRIKSYLMKRGSSEAAAEEVVQNTMIAVWEKAKSYSPQKAAASTWIFTIARNKFIDALRKEKNTVDIDSIAPLVAVADFKSEYDDPEMMGKLAAALKDIPEDQAKLIRMAFFEHKSHNAIAKETRLPLGTVKSRIRTALGRLRRALGNKEQA